MRKRIYGLAVAASLALLAAGVGQASAVTCSSQVNSNGGTTLAGATYIGTVAAGCQLGPYNASLGQNGPPPSVNLTLNPSIFKFDWDGGFLTIKEETGNNGIGHYVFVELGLSGSTTLNADKSLSSPLVSVTLPYSLGPIAPVVVFADNLAAGTYFLDTYLGPCAVTSGCSGGAIEDPQYQVLFTPGGGAVPLPGTLAMLGPVLGGFGGLLALRRRRRQTA